MMPMRYFLKIGNKVLKKSILFFISLILLVVIAFLLKVITYAIPSDRIKNNIKNDADYFSWTGNYLQLAAPIDRADSLDYYTECYLVNECYSADYEKPIEAAIENNTFITPGDNGSLGGALNLTHLLNEESNEKLSFATYWHGSTVVMRPLFYLWGYSKTIYVVNILFFIITISAYYFIRKKIGEYEAICFLVSFMCVKVTNAALMICTIMPFIIGTIGIILVLNNKKNEYIVFEVLGFVTGYFDWMSTPIVALGLPLVFLVLRDYCRKDFINQFKKIIGTILIWGGGYAFCIISKWMINMKYYGYNLFSFMETYRWKIVDDINKDYMEHPQNVVVYLWEAMKLNFSHIELFRLVDSTGILAFGVMMVSWIAIGTICLRKKVNCNILLLLFVGLAPIAWIVVFHGHVFVHHFFTYRMLCVFILSILCAGGKLLKVDCLSKKVCDRQL